MKKSMLAWTLMWLAAHLAVFIGGFHKQRADPDLAHINTIGLSVFTSRGAGLCLVVDLLLLIPPVSRNLLTLLRRIPFIRPDAATHFHIWAALTMALMACVHTGAHYVNFFRLNAIFGAGSSHRMHYTSFAGITGHLMLYVMHWTFPLSLFVVRKKRFELFYYTHHLNLVFILLALMHPLGCFVSTKTKECRGYYTQYFASGIVALFLVERAFRWYRSRSPATFTSAVLHPCNTIELRFTVQHDWFHPRPGQYLMLCIPSISPWQWHPFTVTSAPQDPFISIHVRACGDWTRALHTRLLDTESIASLGAGCIDGPFGAPVESAFDHEIAILIATGIGITPFASLIRHLWHTRKRRFFINKRAWSQKPFRVEVHWICRDPEAFSWFRELMRDVEADLGEDVVRIRVHVTKRMSKEDIYALHMDAAESGNHAQRERNPEMDAMTWLRRGTEYGRPNWKKEFGAIVDEVLLGDGLFLGGGREQWDVSVGVFCCGNPALVAGVTSAVNNVNGVGGIPWKVYHERF